MKVRRTIHCGIGGWILGVALLATAPAQAQQAGGFRGRVTDEEGRPIAGAQVIATNRTTGVQYGATADRAGAYTISPLPAGVYTLRLQAIGYRGVERTDQRLETGERGVVDFRLEAAPVELEALTVTTATRSPTSINKVPGSVSVVDRERIETRAPRNVQEILRQVPGVSLSRAGGLGGQIVMRGFNSNDPRTLLLIDGDRFRGRNTLEYNLLDPNQIERIEVIRGPASTLYGPDAMAGVVNVITRRAEGDIAGPFRLTPRLRALSYNGANDLFGGRLELQGLGSGVDLLLGISGRAADDYESPQGEILNSDFETLSTDLRLGVTPSLGHRFELAAKYAAVETGRAGGIGGAPSPPLVQRRDDPLIERFVKLSYGGSDVAGDLAQIQASLYARELFTRIAVDNRIQANRLTQAEVVVDGPVVVGGKLFGVTPWGSSRWTVGTDFFHEMRQGTRSGARVTNFNPDGSISSISEVPQQQNGPDSKQTDVGLFVHSDWDPSPLWTVAAGGRVDYIRTTSETDPVPIEALRAAFEDGSQNTETPITGSLGVVYRPWQALHFTGNVGRAFRAPATFESFGFSRVGTGFLVPNPGLESEKSVTYEIGARLRLSRLNANLTAFHSDYSNLIVRRSVTFQGLPSSQRQNAGEAEVQGLELDATWGFAERWAGFTNAAYLRGTNTGADQPLSYIPPLNGLAGLRYTPSDGLHLEGVGNWSLRRDRIDPDEERETAGFAVLHLYAGVDLWKLSRSFPELRFGVGVENVFDQSYRQPTTVEDVRFPRSNANPLLEPGRALSLTLTSRF